MLDSVVYLFCVVGLLYGRQDKRASVIISQEEQDKSRCAHANERKLFSQSDANGTAYGSLRLVVASCATLVSAF